jgi:tetratricopeptide (TPR) repeat protein
MRLAADDEFWIVLGTGLRRLSQAPSRSRAAAARRLATALMTFVREADANRAIARGSRKAMIPASSANYEDVALALMHFPQPSHAAALVTHVRGVAADAEEAGAVMLAREMLTDLRELSAHAPPADRGLILIQLGRIARTLGDLDVANDLFSAVGQLGRATGTPELEVREAAAKAVLARTRGNYPAARSLFESALTGARELGLADVEGLAHQGLMIVAAEAGDYDAAMRHGWQALSAARSDGARQAEALGNLAHLCATVGYDSAALGGFAAALVRTSAPRLRLPILAGMATSAARLGDSGRVAETERAVAHEASDAFPFETAGAWLAVARAQRLLGDAAAGDAAAEKAAAIARAHKFHEITLHLEQERPKPPLPLADAGMGVVRSLEAWSADPASYHALSSVSTD